MVSPSLVVRRIVVTGEYSLDQRFTTGLNVIRGVQSGRDVRSINKAGKTALVELIRFGLGRRVRVRDDFHLASIMDRLDTLA